MNSTLTSHAALRLAQRGMSVDEIELIMLLGTEVEGGYIVLEKERRHAEQQVRSLLDQIRRLHGKRLVLKKNTILTAYRASARKERKLLRHAEEREVTRRG